MINRTKKLETIVVVTLVTIFSFVCLPAGYATGGPSVDSALVFLRDVVKLDMAKYNATLVLGPFVDHRPEMGGITETTGDYNLEYENSTLDVLFTFIQNILTWCDVTVMKGAPLYSQPLPANFGDAVREFMQRCSVFYNSPSLAMQSELSALDFSRNSTTVVGNLKLKVEIDSSLRFSVSDTFNGAEYGGLSVTFENEHFRVFGDSRSYYKVGDPVVTFTRDQAVNMALEQTKNFSYTYAGSEVKNFTVVKDHISSELLTKSKYKPLELYPYWQVTLPLNNFYPGYVTQIIVEIWAGTSEVIAVYPLGVGGGATPEDSPTPTPSPDSISSPAVSTSASPAAEPSASALFPSESPPSTTSSPPQLTASSSFAPADNDEMAKPTDYGLLVVAVVVCVGVVAAVSLAFVAKRRRVN